MYRPPLRHVRPHMAAGVDVGPRPRDSGDIGLIAAASAPVRLSPISMAVASPYFSSSLRMTDLSEGRAPTRKYDPESKASQPCRPNVEPGLKQALVLLDQLDGDPALEDGGDAEPSLACPEGRDERRARLADLLAQPPPGLRFSAAIEGDGAVVLRHACALGLEGIVSKRRDAPYRSGRSRTWLKIKCEGYERR